MNLYIQVVDIGNGIRTLVYSIPKKTLHWHERVGVTRHYGVDYGVKAVCNHSEFYLSQENLPCSLSLLPTNYCIPANGLSASCDTWLYCHLRCYYTSHNRLVLCPIPQIRLLPQSFNLSRRRQRIHHIWNIGLLSRIV